MKVIWEFDLDDEKKYEGCMHDLQMYQNARNMYCALFDIQEYLRQLDKGYKPFDMDEVIETIRNYLIDAKIDEIP